MIIGNNQNNNSMPNSFNNNWQNIKQNTNVRNQNKNVFVKDIKDQKYTNPLNNNDMYDKTLAMLHERLEKNLITMEEFNKKCAQLGSQRQNKNNKLF